MKIIITEQQSKLLKRILRRVITENSEPEWVDSLERRLNRSIEINRDKPFTNSPQASVWFNGKNVDIEIHYENFMKDSVGVGYVLKDIVDRVIKEIGEENGIEFKFNSHNVAAYERAKHAQHSYESDDFRNDSYRLKFVYKVIEDDNEITSNDPRHLYDIGYGVSGH
jgi:hypothetical protein